MLERVDAEVRAGAHAAGFLAYEAAPAFDPAMVVHPPIEGLPLASFTLFAVREQVEPLAGLPAADSVDGLTPLLPSTSRGRYESAIARILELIAAGDCYQVNHTLRLRGAFQGEALALYRMLCEAQRAAYCAYIDLGRYQLISASPELFFQRCGDEIRMRPMKGTSPRGRCSEEDETLADALVTSEKERAENLMIVDLLRNDLGRVSEYGSVSVPSLFEVERYPTVHQLTSTVTAKLRPDLGLHELFRALFPSGSVTGAPKLRTMEIIRDLEDSPRGVYTGAIGFVSPDETVFSVAIRTLVLDPVTGALELGVGSGVTSGSDTGAEYEESIGKGAFVTARQSAFEILEALRLEVPGGYPLLESHLERMRSSAKYFGFTFDADRFRSVLARVARDAASGTYKVRVVLSRSGKIDVTAEPILVSKRPLRLGVSDLTVDSNDPFVYHKTTHRPVLEAAMTRARSEYGDPIDDVILLNERGEVTESSTANVVIEVRGRFLTPPIRCGLLPGVQRAQLLSRGDIDEQILTPDDLRSADRIYLINSVRGWREAELC